MEGDFIRRFGDIFKKLVEKKLFIILLLFGLYFVFLFFVFELFLLFLFKFFLLVFFFLVIKRILLVNSGNVIEFILFFILVIKENKLKDFEASFFVEWVDVVGVFIFLDLDLLSFDMFVDWFIELDFNILGEDFVIVFLFFFVVFFGFLGVVIFLFFFGVLGFIVLFFFGDNFLVFFLFSLN